MARVRLQGARDRRYQEKGRTPLLEPALSCLQIGKKLFFCFVGSSVCFFSSFFSNGFRCFSSGFGCDGCSVCSGISGFFGNVSRFCSDSCVFGDFCDFGSDSGLNSGFFSHFSSRSRFFGNVCGFSSNVSGNFSRCSVEVCSGFGFGNGWRCASCEHGERCGCSGDKFDIHVFTLSETL